MTRRPQISSPGPLVLLLAAIAFNGCNLPMDNPSTDGGDANVAVAQAADGKLTLRVLAADAGTPRYLFADANSAIGLAELTNRLVAASAARPSATTLYVYTYSGASGYDVLRALDAATIAGLERVEGVADFTDDSSDRARANWKSWSKTLEKQQSPSVSDSTLGELQ